MHTQNLHAFSLVWLSESSIAPSLLCWRMACCWLATPSSFFRLSSRPSISSRLTKSGHNVYELFVWKTTNQIRIEHKNNQHIYLFAMDFPNIALAICLFILLDLLGRVWFFPYSFRFPFENRMTTTQHHVGMDR